MVEHGASTVIGSTHASSRAEDDVVVLGAAARHAVPGPDDAEPAGSDAAVTEAVARERGRIVADLRAVVVDALHRLQEFPADTEDPEGAERSARHAGTALDAVHRAAALGGLPVPTVPSRPARGRSLRPAALVVGTLLGGAAMSLTALVVVLLPGTVAAGPLLVVALAVAVALTGRHAPVLAGGVVLATVLAVLAVAAPFATTTAPTTAAVAGAVDLALEAAPEPGECLLLGVVLAAAYAIGLHRRRRAIATGRGNLLHAFDEHARGDVEGRLGLAPSVHRTLVVELRVLADHEVGEPRRLRIARHRVATILPTLAAVDAEPVRPVGEAEAVLDEGRVVVLVAAARHAAALGGQTAARHAGRPPSVVVRGVPVAGCPEVGLLAARLLAELVAEVTARSGPVAACVNVEHRDDALVLEVASGRSRVPGARPGRAPAGLAERAALLGGTVEVTSCREAISVRVVLPVAGSLPAAVAADSVAA